MQFGALDQHEHSAVNAMDPEIEPLAIKVDTFCKLYDCGRTTAFALMKSGRLKSMKVCGMRRILMASAKELLCERSDS